MAYSFLCLPESESRTKGIDEDAESGGKGRTEIVRLMEMEEIFMVISGSELSLESRCEQWRDRVCEQQNHDYETRRRTK